MFIDQFGMGYKYNGFFLVLVKTYFSSWVYEFGNTGMSNNKKNNNVLVYL